MSTYPSRRTLTNAGVRELLHVGEWALRELRDRSNDPLPHMRAGRRYLYDELRVLRWAERQARREALSGKQTPSKAHR